MKRSTTKEIQWILAVCIMLLMLTPAVFAQDNTSTSFEFTDTPILTAERDIQPVEYKAVRMNRTALQTTLSAAPQQATGRLLRNAEISLPYPDGTFKRFHIVEAPIMEEGLAAKYPTMKTYRVAGIDDASAYGRISITPAGFHGIIFRPSGSFYIDPFNAQQPDYAMVYERSNFVETFQRRVGVKQHEPIVSDPAIERASIEAALSEVPQFSGSVHRSYRLAMAATSQYVDFHSAPNRCDNPSEPVACAMAAIVVSMNRVNGLYERDVAVTMNLIDDNDLLISTNPGDYSNNNGSAMLGQNIARINSIIGSANYDIGHVFSTGGGGVAYLGSVCGSNKAGGVTGLPQPIGDPFNVDYVAHEIGHQFAATHTFNGSTGGCGSQRSGQTAFEPGSGTTIMAYAGLCPGQNVQNFSDDYFHIGSVSQMVNFVGNSNTGGSCAEETPTDNNPPVVDAGVAGLTLPISTPFRLEGSATDADGDELVYNWEQYDLGPQGPPNNPTGNAALFRSLPSTEEPVRTFPRMSNVLSGNPTLGERLPDYSRNMRFRLTARDNVPINGGIGFQQVQFSVTDNAGPFLVPVPGNGTQWQSGNDVLVAWDVAGTNVSPINVETVSVYLSTDAGSTFDTVIAESVPNTGSAFVSLPDGVTSSSARIKIMADDHIFFNVSPANFNISTSAQAAVASLDAEILELFVGDDEVTEASFAVTSTNSTAFNYFAQSSDADLPEGALPLPAENLNILNAAGTVPGLNSRHVNFEVSAEGLTEATYATRITLVSDEGVDEVSVLLVLDIRVQSQYSKRIIGNEGWRLTAAPVEEETVSGVLQNFTTQGFPGADNEDAELNPSVYFFNDTELKPVPDADFTIEAGQGVLTYLFDDDMLSNLNALGFSNRSPFEMQLSNQQIIDDGEFQQGWNLKGNPFDQTIDLNNLTSEDFQNAGRSFQIWKPSLNGGAGGYLAWNGHDIYPGSAHDSQVFRGKVEAFQGFWISATGNNASLNLDKDILTDPNATPDPDEVLPAAYYTLELTADDFTTYSTVMFSDQGSTGKDPYDADELSALSNEYAYFYSVAGNKPRNINSLPLNDGSATVDVPMNVEASFSGDFQVRLVKVSGSLNNFGGLTFTDQSTGESVSLDIGDSYTFSYEATDNGDNGSADPVKVLDNLPGHRLPDTDPRFIASFDLNIPVNTQDEELNLPKQVQLNQNYPNPFNPTTNISFGLPQSAEVNLEVYNIAGQRVATVVSGRMNSGYHTVTFDASRLASGVYLYRLTAAGQVRTEKMTLIK